MEPITRPAETFAERRKYTRFQLKLRVCYTHDGQTQEAPDPEPDNTLESMTRDLGLGGIAMVADEALKIGQLLQVRLDLPALEDILDDQEDCLSAADKTVNLLSRVVWCRPMDGRYLVGVQFLELDHKDVAVLRDFLEEYRLSDKEAATSTDAPPA